MTRLLISATLGLALTGCGLISRPIVTTPPARCAALVPQGWAEGVEAAPVPADQSALIATLLGKPLTEVGAAALISPWASAYVQQDAQLSKANGRVADAMAIFQNCEKLVNAARADRQ